MKLTKVAAATKSAKTEFVPAPLVESTTNPHNMENYFALMGIEPGTPEYENVASELRMLKSTNPALYHKITNMD